MTQDEHLDKVIAKCREIISLGEQRTQGRWTYDPSLTWPGNGIVEPITSNEMGLIPEHDASFIAACAGPAEAAARATIYAIEGLRSGAGTLWNPETNAFSEAVLQTILASWPESLL